MLEFEENRPRRRRTPAVVKTVVVLVLLLFAANLAYRYRRPLVSFLRHGLNIEDDSPAPSEQVQESIPAPEPQIGPFGISDEWLNWRIAKIETPTIPVLAPLLDAAPTSLVLLRYLASISNQKASSAIAARMVELAPRFSRSPTSFEGMVLWRGSRRIGGDGEKQSIRHHFFIPSNATLTFPDCAIDTRYMSFSGDELASDEFSLSTDAITVLSHSLQKDSLEFFVERPLPQEIVNAGGGSWSLELGVTIDGGKRPLRPDGGAARKDEMRARIDFLE